MTAELDVAAEVDVQIGKDDDADQRMRKQLLIPRPFTRGFGVTSATPAAAGTTPVDIGGPDVGREWMLRRFFAGMPSLSPLVPQQSATTGGNLYKSGSATDPAANTTIVTLTPPAGYYNVIVTAGYGGTAGTVQNNFSVIYNGGGANTFQNLEVPLAANVQEQFTFQAVFLNGSNSISVSNPTVDAAGVYLASILLQPLLIQNFFSVSIYLAPAGYSVQTFNGGDFIWQDTVFPLAQRWGDEEQVVPYPMHVFGLFYFPAFGVAGVAAPLVQGSISGVDRRRYTKHG